MKRAGLVAAIAAMLMVSAGNSRAEQKFDDLAAKATPVAGLWGLSSLLWSRSGACANATNDLDRRQCEGIRDARLEQLAGKTFLFTGDSKMLELGAWSEKSLSVPVNVKPCLACDAPVDIDGEKLFVVGQGALKVSGGTIEVAPIHKKTYTFKDAAGFEKWKADTLPRVRSELIVRVDKAARWSKGGSAGLRIDVVAWRIYDPCTGNIVATKPTSAKLTPDKRACGAEGGEPEAPEASKNVEPERPVKKDPVLPRQLSPYQINQGMAPSRKQASKCFDAYGVPGKASFKVTISNEGKVSKLVQTGDFVDTPTGTCIEKSIKEATFPKMKKKSITFDFPVVLQ